MLVVEVMGSIGRERGRLLFEDEGPLLLNGRLQLLNAY